MSWNSRTHADQTMPSSASVAAAGTGPLLGLISKRINDNKNKINAKIRVKNLQLFGNKPHLEKISGKKIS